MKKNIPKPVKSIKSGPDKRKEFLLKWKHLFEEIRPDIKVFIKGDHDFSVIMENLDNNVTFDTGGYIEDSVLYVELPTEIKIELGYLVGMTHNRMFSEKDVEIDLALIERQGLPCDCQPKTKTWGRYYKELVKLVNFLHKEILKPVSII
ncbi:hypothetical protein A3C57_02040 [Candidatus Nomurabacteria bacterium RIFCSPHIGHO2_02_FULL_33_12]|uniref:Uncharacterized protein n=1 Tax=Candidatus Nomurabacteria bacterium RIFCSPLOWO2_01_FULL_33_17 TaxID=1801764 RepID=A0A1F6WP66_9BACT|nr:MAG: hypothetical protein A3C57_02040 [Candidatus Nomurabacteria bacterium RIFCSPHIGHO2_02_FULL_33_12]OGI83678.1 MAG: hypothetical protein A2903_01310 [Candidatus Nomurabacteria bacterium RIFCSPLOWO2_01_FULL_33_17]